MLSLADVAMPIVQAPMAGGPSTPALTVAVSEAGGLGFLAAANKTVEAMAEDIAAVRAETNRPFGVNLFRLSGPPADPATVAAYLDTLRADGVDPLDEPRFDDDAYDAKLAHLLADPVPVVSFTFGCPEAASVKALHAAGSAVWVTVTTPAEAASAEAAGADALIAQGVEAGGHRGTFDDDDAHALAILPLLQMLDTDLPVIAAGGLATGAAVVSVLAAGASAAQLGTAFMLCPEAGTNAAQGERLRSDAPTGLTRAFTGRLARGVVNDFQRRHGSAAPSAYPEIHVATRPFRAQAAQEGDADGFHLWAGQAHALARPIPAAQVVAEVMAEGRAALDATRNRLGSV